MGRLVLSSQAVLSLLPPPRSPPALPILLSYSRAGSGERRAHGASRACAGSSTEDGTGFTDGASYSEKPVFEKGTQSSAIENAAIGKPGGGPTQCKGSRGHSGNAQLHENGRLQRPNNEAGGFSASEQF